LQCLYLECQHVISVLYHLCITYLEFILQILIIIHNISGKENNVLSKYEIENQTS